MNKAFVLIAAATFTLLNTSSPVVASESPGRIGAYIRLYDEAASTNKLREELRFMKSVGIDFILPSSKGSAGIYWDSQVAPRELVKNPTYMERIVECAHAEGLKVYPQFCVATEGGESGPNIVLKRNPSWAFFYDGARRGYIDPGNADARRYEVSLIKELVGKYHVDGLSLDYCRCPSHVGYTDTGRAEFLREHKVDLARIVGGTAETPDTESGKKATNSAAASARSNPVWPEWQKWKTAQVNRLAREIRAAVNEARPGLPISSYVWGYNTYVTKSEVCQDWVTWISEGSLDWINPSGYRYTDEAFLQAARLNREHVPRVFPFYITIGVKTSHGALKDAAEVRKQIQMARECGADGVVFFTWEALRPFAKELAPDIKGYGQTK
jgi:uncharacterized lipoprotein YddW (UPF0748 family)